MSTGLREIQIRRFQRLWDSMKATLCAAYVLEGSDEIATFLKLADLNVFEAAFRNEGVTKISHIVDVTAEDLEKIGIFYKFYVYQSVK